MWMRTKQKEIQLSSFFVFSCCFTFNFQMVRNKTAENTFQSSMMLKMFNIHLFIFQQTVYEFCIEFSGFV